MLIQSSPAAGAAYVPYAKNIKNLAKSTQRLASGQQTASAADGAGQLGVADLMRLRIQGTNALVSSMQNALGYSASQDQVLGNVSDILSRMAELSASAIDGTKVTADRVALDAEFKSLISEVSTLAALKYNGQSLFGVATTIRTGVESSDTVSFASIDLGSMVFTAMSVINAGVASTALSRLRTKTTSLAALRNKARSNNVRVERTLDIAQAYITNLGLAESAIRDVDVALETGNLMKQQMLAAAGQSVIAQANNLVQSAQRFFQF